MFWAITAIPNEPENCSPLWGGDTYHGWSISTVRSLLWAGALNFKNVRKFDTPQKSHVEVEGFLCDNKKVERPITQNREGYRSLLLSTGGKNRTNMRLCKYKAYIALYIVIKNDDEERRSFPPIPYSIQHEPRSPVFVALFPKAAPMNV
jgi:hypothetical protein